MTEGNLSIESDSERQARLLSQLDRAAMIASNLEVNLHDNPRGHVEFQFNNGEGIQTLQADRTVQRMAYRFMESCVQDLIRMGAEKDAQGIIRKHFDFQEDQP